VRELKQSLDVSSIIPACSPRLLRNNVVFGKKFDELFHALQRRSRIFRSAAGTGRQHPGNVDGMDVTVDHVAALKETELLKIDYGEALDKFRRVSKLKRALERRPQSGG